jgi:hypothetical protein
LEQEVSDSVTGTNLNHKIFAPVNFLEHLDYFNHFFFAYLRLFAGEIGRKQDFIFGLLL